VLRPLIDFRNNSPLFLIAAALRTIVSCLIGASEVVGAKVVEVVRLRTGGAVLVDVTSRDRPELRSLVLISRGFEIKFSISCSASESSREGVVVLRGDNVVDTSRGLETKLSTSRSAFLLGAGVVTVSCKIRC
jgi:hypothetical protein